MGKYSKRKRSRSRCGSKRKRRGGDVATSLSNATGSLTRGVNDATDHVKTAAGKVGSAATGFMGDGRRAVSNFGDKMGTSADEVGADASSAVTGIAKTGEGAVSSIKAAVGGRGRGGSGKCCFPAKFCGSRKRKGNKRRSIKSGRCCIPVKSKKCGAKKKNGRKTRKSKRKKGRGTFNMFGGG